MDFFRSIGLASVFIIAMLTRDCLEPLSAQEAGEAYGNAAGPANQYLSREQARKYMLDLINRDRASVGVPPVILDEVATRAAELHSDEMAEIGYLSHWSTDGRKPDQRYTECGGKDVIAENAYAYRFPEPQKLPLCKRQEFTRQELEDAESRFFNEKPPMVGHRVNIIDAVHNGIGIGLSVAGAEPEPGVSRFASRLAFTQEFVNHYGSYANIPQCIEPGEGFSVEGNLAPSLKFFCIDLRREDFPEPMSIGALNKTYSYNKPEKILFSYFPPPFVCPQPVQMDYRGGGEHFLLPLQTGKSWRPGLYYVSIWGTINERSKPILISVRTIRLGSTNRKKDRANKEAINP